MVPETGDAEESLDVEVTKEEVGITPLKETEHLIEGIIKLQTPSEQSEIIMGTFKLAKSKTDKDQSGSYDQLNEKCDIINDQNNQLEIVHLISLLSLSSNTGVYFSSLTLFFHLLPFINGHRTLLFSVSSDKDQLKSIFRRSYIFCFNFRFQQQSI